MSTTLRLSIQEYEGMIERGVFDRIERRIELIRGELRETSPAGPVHDELIAYLTRWSISVTLAEPIAIRIHSGLDLPEQESRPEPDVLWVDARRYFDRHPLAIEVHLAIEVANSSLQYDLSEKAALYAEAGVHEYWIVDAKALCIHSFVNPHHGVYQLQQTFAKGSNLAPTRLPKAVLNISDLFDS